MGSINVAAVVLASTAIATPASAQAVAQSGRQTGSENTAAKALSADSPAGDIVVTARRVSERAQEVPVALTAVGSAELARVSVRDIGDVGKIAPGIFFQAANGNSTAFWVATRGQFQADTILTQDPSTGFYLDGVYIPRTSGIAGALVDIDRVEVLRGPQGTLYGRNTTGGAVSTYTKAPTDELGGYVRGQVGNYGQRDILGVVNVPIEALDGGLRLVGNLGRRGGIGHNAIGTPLLSKDNSYGRLRFVANPSDRFKIDLTADYSHINDGGQIFKMSVPPSGATLFNYVLATGLNPTNPASFATALAGINAQSQGIGKYNTGSVTASYSRATASTGGLTLSYDLNDDVTLRSISGYRFMRYQSVNDFTDFDFGPLIPIAGQRDNFYSEEGQLLGGGKRLNWIVGGYYSYEKGHEFATAQAVPFANPTSPTVYDGDAINTNLSAYGQVSYEIVPRVRLTGGLRYTTENRKMTSSNRDALTCYITGLPLNSALGPSTDPAHRAECTGRFAKRFSNLSWLASMDYKITPDILLYAKVSRGYVSGGQNLRGVDPATYAPFDPEKSTQYEAGEKAQFFNRRLTLNTAFYYTDYRNIQRFITITTTAGGTGQAITNAGSARIYGFEFEGRLRLTNELNIGSSVAYTNARYKKFVDLTGDRSKEPFAYPEWTYGINAAYVKPTGFGRFDVSANWRWQDDVVLQGFIADRAATTQKAYGILDGKFTVGIDAWNADVSLFGRNLLNKYYATGAIGVSGLGFVSKLYGEPRTYGVELVFRFGGEK